MGKLDKTFAAMLAGTSDANIRFADLVSVLYALGFSSRIKGSHHIFWKQGVADIINIQPVGSQAKAYQVKQVRGIVVRHKMSIGERDE